ncbi:MAG: diguanylate cyclase [Dissulfurispiraceae bacterium]
MKVLVATNAIASAKELRMILEAEGIECLMVNKSCQTIDIIYHDTPEMVMLDVALTRPSAVEILLKLKSAPSTWDIPVILMASSKSKAKIAKCYELGAYDYISKPFFKEEIVARIRNIGYVCEKMKELEKLLVKDYLTGVYNRKFLMERFVEELAWATRYQEPLSLIFLDIDHFKKINDTYGHSCGDEVLKQLAKTLSSALRVHDIVARYGGEEFVILLSNTGWDDSLTVAEKIRVTIEESDFFCDENPIKMPITVSIGVTSTEGELDLLPDSLIVKADQALYEAKAAGRNRVVSSSGKGSISVNEG